MTSATVRAHHHPARLSRIAGTLLLFLILTTAAIIFILPVYGIVVTSLKSVADVSTGGYWNLPPNPTLDNYMRVLDPEGGNLIQFLWNSLKLTIPASLISIALGILAGYGLAKYSFPGNGTLFVFLVAGMFLPPQIALIPVFRMMNQLGLYDTLWSVILVHSAFGIPICTLVMRNFFQTVPDALREAAFIDGANEYQIFGIIMLPLTLPALAVLATLQFTWIWNDFLWPLILIKSEPRMTIQMGILQLRGQYGLAWGNQAAGSLIATIPTLLLFIFMQRHFIHGLSMGGVKE